MTNVEITDGFGSEVGTLAGYATYDEAIYTKILAERHIDIASFGTLSRSTPQLLYTLEGQELGDLDGTTMGNLAISTTNLDDVWTVDNGATITVGPSTSYPGASTRVAFPGAGTYHVHVALQRPVNTNLLPTAQLVWTAVNFPSQITGWTTSGTGAELRQPNPGGTINALTLTVTTTGACTLELVAVRLLPTDAEFATWAVNTRSGILERNINRFGELANDYVLPKIFRSGPFDDPAPIDINLMLTFNSGSISTPDWEPNFIRIYLRERTEDYLTQLDLDAVDLNNDGVPEWGFTQKQLNEGREHEVPRRSQPDFGQALLKPLPQRYLDVQPQGALDAEAQAELERMPDTVAEAWIEATLKWEPNYMTVIIKDTETPESQAYRFERIEGMTANTNYALSVELEDDEFRLQIFSLDGLGQISSAIFDTGVIKDDFMFKRRKGRVGWEFFSNDKDVAIRTIRSHLTMFAEYRSMRMESLTPVEGARLFASASPPSTVALAAAPAALGGEVVLDPNKTRHNGSLRVTTRHTLEGIETDSFTIDDFTQTTISFDLFYPHQGLDSGGNLTAHLIGDQGTITQLTIGRIHPNVWQTINIEPVEVIGHVAGESQFRLAITQPEEITTTWWIENIRVNERSIAWYGRATPGDPWGMHQSEWVPFKDLINSDTDGILFPERGRELQVQARALRQDAVIERVAFKPKYAELGRLIWDENPPVGGSATVAFTSTALGSSGPGGDDFSTNTSASYEAADPTDKTFSPASPQPPSALEVHDGGGYLVPDIRPFSGEDVHWENSYGQVYIPSYPLVSGTMTAKYWSGHNAVGTIARGYIPQHQRYDPFVGLNAKVQPDHQSGILCWWDMQYGGFGTYYWDYSLAPSSGWQDFGHPGGMFPSIGDVSDFSTFTAGPHFPLGETWNNDVGPGVPIVPGGTYNVYHYSSFYLNNPIPVGQPDTFYWLKLRAADNLIEFELWDQDPATADGFLIKLTTHLVSPAAQAKFGAAPGGFGIGGWWEPSPTSYFDEWTLDTLSGGGGGGGSSRSFEFTSTSTAFPGHPIVNETWYFGDGASTVGHVVEHTYAEAGVYPVTLVVMDDAGTLRSTTQTVTVD